MIFVTVGAEKFSFHRLVQAMDELAGAGAFAGEPMFIQSGSSSYEPQHASFEPFLSFPVMRERIREAKVVVSHAGAGSSLFCLQSGKRPIVVPRLKVFGEHVDDHQLAFAERLHLQGLVRCVRDVESLEQEVREKLSDEGGAESLLPSGEVVGHLERLIGDWEAA